MLPGFFTTDPLPWLEGVFFCLLNTVLLSANAVLRGFDSFFLIDADHRKYIHCSNLVSPEQTECIGLS